MNYNLKKLSLWFLLYFLITDVLGRLIDSTINGGIEQNFHPRVLALTLSVGIVFYLYALASYTIFYKWYQKKPVWIILMVLTIYVCLIVGLRYLIEEVFYRGVFGFGNYKSGVALSYYFLDNFYYVFQYCALGIIFYFWQYSKNKDERNNQLVLENQRMELDLLRSQTNPHFLFNTLNNIYALVNINSEKALTAIEKLSLLLRYSLYKTKNLVALSDEISQIHNFIELESLRHKEEPQVNIRMDSHIQQGQVPQFILLPFVENAFKHGQLHNESQPITIKIIVANNTLNYEVSNAIAQKEKDSAGGLGLDNLKKRLELLFPKQHSCEYETVNSIFNARLTIPLS